MRRVPPAAPEMVIRLLKANISIASVPIGSIQEEGEDERNEPGECPVEEEAEMGVHDIGVLYFDSYMFSIILINPEHPSDNQTWQTDLTGFSGD
ncbi:MAG: hypothetical protein D5R99_07475 [Methanocalculus sp. MSAO_Arc1]|uniref:hypothetical protein n=1 Tax=Methanocalculus TaxID=71151 RepID=UPI000FF75DE6|nr:MULTISPECIES: hypothetical protein [unclassified Methanocalculus]MCP1661364.1 hypothetical protein [Methanocalculus sp. AMF5]RQD79656.1 MAG: hypothetical protein D5R99_07475 [Methanocalculus sp. MSAO_Arc1]